MKVCSGIEKINPLEVNIDTVYIRTNIHKIITEDGECWEYNEEQFSIPKYLEMKNEELDIANKIIVTQKQLIDSISLSLSEFTDFYFSMNPEQA